MSAPSLSLGGTTLLLKRDMEAMVARGQEYQEGSAADSLLWSAILNSLNRAVSDWRSPTQVICAGAKEHVLEFLAKVSPNQIARLDWAIELCRIILTRHDARMAGFHCNHARP